MKYKSVFLPFLALAAAPAFAQDVAVPTAQPAIVFKSGTGDASLPSSVYVKPPRPEIGCEALRTSLGDIEMRFFPADFAAGGAPPRNRLDRGLFDKAMAGYRNTYCSYGRTLGPAVIVVVDFARHSSQPRLYRIDLRSGDGIDTPIVVAHGIGSDPDDDGFANFFSNVQESLTSSLGAARGGERYVGQNGISLRLDGLEPSNSQMRTRDIVVHSYGPERRRYFNADLINARGGKPGASEGCFVVEPHRRDWIMDTLENGGYLYSGFSGKLPMLPVPVPVPVQNVTFVRGTGASVPAVSIVPAAPGASGMPAGTSGSPPTAPISPAPAVQGQ